MEQLLRDGLSTLGLPEDGIPSLLRYAELLVEKNKVMNLTAITEPADIATLHFLDSAALLSLADFRGEIRGGCRDWRRISRCSTADYGADHPVDTSGFPQ